MRAGWPDIVLILCDATPATVEVEGDGLASLMAAHAACLPAPGRVAALWQALLLAVSGSERSDLRQVPDQCTIRSVRRSGGAWLAPARNFGIAAKAVVAPHPFLRSSEPLFWREGDESAGREGPRLRLTRTRSY